MKIEKIKELLEMLAIIEHEQWMGFVESMRPEIERLDGGIMEGWKERWKPYKDLPEKEKEKDRNYARKVLELLMGMGVLSPKRYDVSIGELIDRLAITNIKIWHLDSKLAELNKSKKKEDKIEAGEIAAITRDANNERVAVREEINLRIEGKTRGTSKIEYTRLGRGII